MRLSVILREGLVYGVLIGIFGAGIGIFLPIIVGGLGGLMIIVGILGLGCLIRGIEAISDKDIGCR